MTDNKLFEHTGF